VRERERDREKQKVMNQNGEKMEGIETGKAKGRRKTKKEQQQQYHHHQGSRKYLNFLE